MRQRPKPATSDAKAAYARSLKAVTVALGARYAREYMHTRNFALGGLTPADLLTRVGGEAAVLNELHASLNGGPV
jgi:hypothetical protein